MNFLSIYNQKKFIRFLRLIFSLSINNLNEILNIAINEFSLINSQGIDDSNKIAFTIEY